jgi:outer membrane protein TolC
MLAVIANYRRSIAGLLIGAILTAVGGCARNNEYKFADSTFEHYKRVTTETKFADVSSPAVPPTEIPLSLATAPREFWDLPLQEALQLSLQNSQVMRDLGGLVLRSPQTARSVQTPAITELDPRFGVEAALAEFDTNFAARTSWEKNDRAINNLLLGGGTNIFTQDLGVAQYQLQKRSVTGATFTARHTTDYDANNAPANLFGSAWGTNFEGEIRQPLLQNAGVEINRLNGANGIPGQANGVLIARANTDIAIADFEIGVRDMVSNVENAYWDLYYAYRDLDAKTAARDSALDSWRRVQALAQAGRKGGEADKEAEAREQYFRFQEEVQNALTGRLIDGTQTNNGSSGGSFRGTGGVQVTERRLRLLIGLPITDGRMLRPSDQPKLAKIDYDWYEALSEAVVRRAELRKQQWVVKRREMEMLAARNFLLPQLDTVGRYRFRGFGKDLINPQSDGVRFDNAYENLTDGDFQEWQVGLELNMPLGFRRGHAAVRQAELQVARERALLREQERDVQSGLSNAASELERAFIVAQTSYNRRAAAKEQLGAVQAAYESDKAGLDLVLDSQRRAVESESRYHASLVEYALAIKNLHFEKGSLLDFNEISLSEGPWPREAYKDAARRDGKGRPVFPLNYIMKRGPAISAGNVPQQTASAYKDVVPETIAPGTTTPTPNTPPSNTTPASPTENTPNQTPASPPAAAVIPLQRPGSTNTVFSPVPSSATNVPPMAGNPMTTLTPPAPMLLRDSLLPYQPNLPPIAATSPAMLSNVGPGSGNAVPSISSPAFTPFQPSPAAQQVQPAQYMTPVQPLVLPAATVPSSSIPQASIYTMPSPKTPALAPAMDAPPLFNPAPVMNAAPPLAPAAPLMQPPPNGLLMRDSLLPYQP